MRKAIYGLLAVVISVGLLGPTGRAYSQSRQSVDFDYTLYGEILKAYVDDSGMVNYKQLKANRTNLDTFVRAMANIDPKQFAKWDEQGRLAIYINAYNALTLKAIIDNYPIKSSWLKSRVYPKNSIRQISGVWNKIKFSVAGRQVTLDHIEHKILRKKFHEPRIHMALVCAAMGCPPLRNEPYLPAKLDEQLSDQSRKFLRPPEKFRLVDNTLYLSPIFKWFGKDFVADYGSDKAFEGYGQPAAAVLSFITGYVGPDVADRLKQLPLEVKYSDYDWSLNEQR